MGIDDPDSIGYMVGGAGVLIAIGQMAWAKFFSTDGRASEALVTQLSERIVNLETRQTKQESDLDEERRLRRLAEDKVQVLEIDNVLLRAELRRHGIDVATALTPAIPQ